MEILFARTKEIKKIKYKGTVGEFLMLLGINQEIVIVVRDNVIITPDIELSNKDKITILPVISGGIRWY